VAGDAVIRFDTPAQRRAYFERVQLIMRRYREVTMRRLHESQRKRKRWSNLFNGALADNRAFTDRHRDRNWDELA
jgi:hypothetical protein